MNPLTLFCRSREFKQGLERSRPHLSRLAYSWSHDPALSDDLVQETLARALKNGYQLRDRGALDGWLFGILVNCWRDHFRRARPTEDIDNHPLTHNVTPEHEHERQRITDKVRQAVGKLPAGQRHVLTLVDLEGCTYAEVAEILEIPIGTVMSRLCRARRALADRLLDFQPAQAKLRRVV